MDKLKRLENESNFEYKVRLCNMKLNKDIDLDWCEIVELLGLGISSDHLRKLSYAYKEYNEYIGNKQINNIEDDELLRKYEEKILELKTERKKLSLTKSEYNRNFNKETKVELLYENLSEKIIEIKPPKFKDIPITKGEKGYILNFSDVHYGSCFKSVNNEYNREIAKQRFEVLLSETKEYVVANNISKLLVVNNADSLQGMLRISDMKMNDIPVVEALVEFSQIMATFLNELSVVCKVDYYQVPSANHSQLRLLNTKAGEMANEDMEKIIINYIGDMLKLNNRVYVHREMKLDNIQFNLCGYNFICLHGHQINNLQTSIRDLSQRERVWIDYSLIGHFHSGKEITVGEGATNNMEVLLSSSFVGSCPYSDKLMLGGKAMAKIYEFEIGKGHVGTRNIILN